MKIAIIGSINRDTIYPFQGPAIKSYGGILYNTIALASFMRNVATVVPICNVGVDVQKFVFQKLMRHQNIEKRGLYRIHQKNPHAILTYTSPSNRREVLENRVPPLTFTQVEPFLNCDLILINFITGFDLSLATLKKIRASFKGCIFIDIHSLTLGIAKDGTRILKHLGNWKEWIQQADIIQLNQIEAQSLADRPLSNQHDLTQFAQHILENGPHIVLITLGIKGSVAACKRNSQAQVHRCPALNVETVDTTGCGDVFSAGFIAEYVISHNISTANRCANHAAGINCTLLGLEELERIGEMCADMSGCG